jgi:radical SAM superfamily enzyme YgiQ (UPF0313 family)
MSFLSTTSCPYAKILARQLRAADATVKLAFGGVFATLNAPLIKAQCQEVDFVCRGDGEQLIVDLLERLNDPDTVTGVTWQVVSRAVEHADAKSAAADLTNLSDAAVELAIAGSRAERARIQAMTEAGD